MTEWQRPTILFVHSSDELYGADRVLLEIVRGLQEQYRPVVALPSDVQYRGELTHELRAAGADVRHLDMAVLRRAFLRPSQLPRLGVRFVRGVLALRRIIVEERAVLVHTNTVAALCGPPAAMLARRPHLWDVHENLADEPGPFAAILRLTLLLTPGRILANSRSSARSIVHGSRRRSRKTSVVYYGVIDPAAEHLIELPESEPPDEILPVSFLGRLTARKGIEQALEAVAIVHQQGVPVRFDIYGSVPPNQLDGDEVYRQRAIELGIHDIVRFHGFVPDARFRLPPGGILLVPSQRPEPFGLVLVEGMLARQVVIACRNGGGSDEILENGITGLYCERDHASISAAIAEVAVDPDRRRAIGEAAAAAAHTRFSMQRFHRQMRTIYEQMT